MASLLHPRRRNRRGLCHVCGIADTTLPPRPPQLDWDNHNLASKRTIFSAKGGGFMDKEREHWKAPGRRGATTRASFRRQRKSGAPGRRRETVRGQRKTRGAATCLRCEDPDQGFQRRSAVTARDKTTGLAVTPLFCRRPAEGRCYTKPSHVAKIPKPTG